MLSPLGTLGRPRLAPLVLLILPEEASAADVAAFSLAAGWLAAAIARTDPL